MSRRSRLPGTKAPQSFVVPICSVHGSREHMRRNEVGEWFCVECFDDFIEAKQRQKAGAVHLPSGVKLARKTIRDIYPNRRARRAAARSAR